MRQQLEHRAHRHREPATAEVEAPVETSERAPDTDDLKHELDEVLDEIDEVLEQNAEEFVNGYIQKGGE